jgi:hypothetical protein
VQNYAKNSIKNSYRVFLTRTTHSKDYIRGFRPYNPDFLFVLKQKGSKKFKAMPASLKKLAFAKLNRPNSLPPYVRSFKQWTILRLPLLFFGSPDKADPNLT